MILANATLATMAGLSEYGLVKNAAIMIERGKIQWVGSLDQLPLRAHDPPVHDLAGRLVTPGLIDCHTHLVYAGSRANEFEMRLKGASYAQIAQAGGGITSTVLSTRVASEDELLKTALPRVDRLLAEGVTTIEIKSGYGLDIETELKMLRVARQIGRERAVRVRTSFLGAHAVSREFQDRADDYLNQVCLPALRSAVAENLVDAVDGFCEKIAFDPEQMAKVFQCAQGLGLPVKLHADQLSDLGGAELVARFQGLSADHIEYTSLAGVEAMSNAGTCAVLLPGAFYTLRETQLPPIDQMRKKHICMAVATDQNPGSSPLNSLLLAMNMACTLFRLTPEESLKGTTTHAAKALRLTGLGQIVPGFEADLAIWETDHPAELSYQIGGVPLHRRVFAGAFA